MIRRIRIYFKQKVEIPQWEFHILAGVVLIEAFLVLVKILDFIVNGK